MQKQAAQLVSGEFVRVPVFAGTPLERREFQGPILVERNPDAGDSVLINYPGGTYECTANDTIEALPRPKLAPLHVVAGRRLDVLVACSDALIAAGWPTLAREQFLEVAQQGGTEHLLRTIHDVFETASAA